MQRATLTIVAALVTVLACGPAEKRMEPTTESESHATVDITAKLLGSALATR